jgi:hypothetical protein
MISVITEATIATDGCLKKIQSSIIEKVFVKRFEFEVIAEMEAKIVIDSIEGSRICLLELLELSENQLNIFVHIRRFKKMSRICLLVLSDLNIRRKCVHFPFCMKRNKSLIKIPFYRGVIMKILEMFIIKDNEHFVSSKIFYKFILSIITV